MGGVNRLLGMGDGTFGVWAACLVRPALDGHQPEAVLGGIMRSYFLGTILEAQGNQGIPDGNQKPGSLYC